MQVLTTNCPYCKQEVESTIEQLDGPVVCPSCKKPFSMEMPKAVVSSVQEVADNTERENRLASAPKERTLATVHPVVFRARPLTTLVLMVVFVLAAIATVLSLAGMTVAGYAFDDGPRIGPASVVTWVCAITLLIVTGFLGYLMILSRFTTLTVTDDRTIYQQGLISRDTSEVQHDDVRNIQLDQSFTQRLLKVGTIGISSSGQDDLEVVARWIPHPERIIKMIRDNQE